MVFTLDFSPKEISGVQLYFWTINLASLVVVGEKSRWVIFSLLWLCHRVTGPVSVSSVLSRTTACYITASPVWRASVSLTPSGRQDQDGVGVTTAVISLRQQANMDCRVRSLLTVRPISEKCTVQVISILSMVTCLATIITYLIILRDPQAWEGVADYVLHWMVDNNLDVTVRLLFTE